MIRWEEHFRRQLLGGPSVNHMTPMSISAMLYCKELDIFCQSFTGDYDHFVI